MAELDGLTLSPLFDGDKLSRVLVTFKDAPGLTLMLTAEASHELRDGLSMILGVADRESYDAARLRLGDGQRRPTPLAMPLPGDGALRDEE